MATAKRAWDKEKREELQTMQNNLQDRTAKTLQTRLNKELHVERKRVHNSTSRQKAGEFEKAAADFRKEKVRFVGGNECMHAMLTCLFVCLHACVLRWSWRR